MDSGNLVLFSDDGENDQLAMQNILWQSFQNPTDTFIPGMLMDKNLELISWRDQDDPGIGNFTFKLDQEGDDQYVISRKSIPYWKSREPGEFSTSAEMPRLVTRMLSNFSMRIVGHNNFTIPLRLVINVTGELLFLTYTKQWNLIWYEPKDQCGEFNACGNFGSCNRNNRPWVCKCLPGFSPQFVEQWKFGDFSSGCARQSKICEKNATFLSLKMMKVGKPNTHIKVDNETVCRNECLSNCLCQAYSYAATADFTRRDDSTSPFCWTWLTELNNLEEEYEDDGHNISVRIALSDSKSTLRDCEPCGTTIIPYPLSTGPDCGDPMYSRFNCSTITGQVSFMGPNGTFFRVISIDPSAQRFVIQTKKVDNCDPINRGKSLQLPFPFNVTSWCNVHRGNFSSQVSSRGTNAVELGWKLPPEPTCTTFADCRGWPHSTCKPARDRKKRCLCNAHYQWSGFSLNCTQEGNLQQPKKLPIEEQPRSKVPVSLILIVVAVLISGIFLACIISVYIWRRKKTKRQGN